MAEFRAGVATAVVTPPAGIRMAGYASRDHGAEGVLDDLVARALYLQSDDGEPLLLLTLDVCYLRREQIARIQASAGGAVDVPPHRVMLNASHTHSGPAPDGGPLEERWISYLTDVLTGAAVWSRSRAVPARLASGRAPVQIGVNRRERRPDGRVVLGVDWNGPVIPHVDLLRFDEPSGRPLVVLFAHACHGTTLNPNCYLLSADWPGVARRRIEAELGCPALFLQGCAGDINPYPRLEPEHIELLGRRVAHAVLKLETELPPAVEVTRLRGGRRTFDLPLEPPPALAAVQADLAAAEEHVAGLVGRGASHGEIWWAQRSVGQIRELLTAVEAGQPPVGAPYEAAALVLNDVALVGSPAEVLCSLGLEVLAGAPFDQTVPLGYTNGWLGYLPSAEVWDEGGYEFDVRIKQGGLPISRMAGEVHVSQSLALLESLA